jgi:hypothetical protein
VAGVCGGRCRYVNSSPTAMFHCANTPQPADVNQRFDDKILHLHEGYGHEQPQQTEGAHTTPGDSRSGAFRGPNGLIPLPSKRIEVMIDDIQRYCDLEGEENKEEWNDINVRTID